MAKMCPICDREIEHLRIERDGSDASQPGSSAGPTASFQIDDLCAAESDSRWNRICTAASVAEGADEPVLEVYYHYFEETEK